MGLGGLFSKPKVPAPPPVPDPVPIPEVEEGTAQKGQRKRKGAAQTVLTGDLVPSTTGRTLLGGR